MPTNPDAISVHADPSHAKTRPPMGRVMLFGPYRVEIHGGPDEYWAQIRDRGAKAFGYGKTLAGVEETLFRSLVNFALNLPDAECDSLLMSITGVSLR